MRIWTVRGDVANFAPSYLVDDYKDDFEICEEWLNLEFNGKKIGNGWQEFKAISKKNKPLANFTDLDSGILICDRLALSELKNCIDNEVEILEMSVDSMPFYCCDTAKMRLYRRVG
ncbi:MAG: hypothetical protein SAJ72_22555 [Jaaginema sp. PMC 1080.18]|nr:hypothetical protein [Jaaginema sp. PMC 1080.18]MEC4869123.1 hypothetical protein [Jaaginema sp. PMC 1078.18]